jgi:hypothetical protein
MESEGWMEVSPPELVIRAGFMARLGTRETRPLVEV